MTEFEKGVPIPRANTREATLDLPLERMEPGDSLAIPKRFAGRVRTKVWRFNGHPAYPGREYLSRVQGDVIRVWRVK